MTKSGVYGYWLGSISLFDDIHGQVSTPFFSPRVDSVRSVLLNEKNHKPFTRLSLMFACLESIQARSKESMCCTFANVMIQSKQTRSCKVSDWFYTWNTNQNLKYYESEILRQSIHHFFRPKSVLERMLVKLINFSKLGTNFTDIKRLTKIPCFFSPINEKKVGSFFIIHYFEQMVCGTDEKFRVMLNIETKKKNKLLQQREQWIIFSNNKNKTFTFPITHARTSQL